MTDSVSPGWAAPGYDALVIGAGLAGLTAATRLAEGGARVMVLAKGVGATHLAPGTIDVLGYAPERVEHVGRSLAGLPATHPYTRLGAGAVPDAIAWFKGSFEDGPLRDYRYRGDLDENLLLPTTVGAAKPSAVVPETMAAGDLRDATPMLVVGFDVLRDFHPSYLADNVTRGGVEARALIIRRRVDGRPEANSVGVARALDQPAFRAEVAARSAARSTARGGSASRPGSASRIRTASGATSRRASAARCSRSRRCRRRSPGCASSAPLRDRLRALGGRIVIGSVAVGARWAGDRVEAVQAQAAGRLVTYRARWVVLATGGVASGGIELDSRWRAREVVLDLPVDGAPAPGEERFTPRYFDDHPFGAVGVAVDERLRPVDAGGARLADNVLVAGATLAGSRPWKEKSGDGISLASGHRAAVIIMEDDR